MPVCARCGAAAPDEARFCPSCGGALAAPSESRKVVTVVFCDLVGSTSLTEGRDPESVRAIVSGYFDEMRTVVERHGGMVEKFVGDEVMAVFGVPEAHEDDALRAVRTAVEMRVALAALNERLEQAQGVRLSIRTAVNTGEVFAGDPIPGQSFLTGEAVIIGKRLEQAARPGEILIGETTYRLVRDAAIAEPTEALRLKGFEEPVPARRLLGVREDAPALARRFDSALVDRVAELSLLRDAFARASDGNGAFVVVLGAPGVGKSRLAAELVDEVGAGTTVLRGRCLSYGDGITFWPVAELVRQAAGIGRSSSPEAARLRIAELVAEESDADAVVERIAGAIALDGATVPVPEAFWAVRRLLESLARRGPLVVAFDDIHWAEPTFLDLIEYLAEQLASAPVLLLCLSRPELLDLRDDWVERASVVRLEPLALDESEALVRNLLGEGEFDQSTATALAGAAEGNPLFVEEIISMLLEDGALSRADGVWRVADLAAIRMPQTIHALLAARLDRLEADDRAVVEAAAVMGKLFPLEALAELMPEEKLDDRLAALVRKELIRPDELATEPTYGFRHVLVQEAVYRAVPKRRRTELHEWFASWIEERRADHMTEVEELVGYHLEQAYRYRVDLAAHDQHTEELGRRASAHLAAGARRATARGDMPAAVKLLDRASQVLPAADPDRLDLLPELGAALKDVGDLPRAAEVLEEAAERAAAAEDRRAHAHALFERAFLVLRTDPSRTAEAFAAADWAVGVFDKLGDEAGLARAWRIPAYRLERDGRLAGIEETLTQALESAERAGDRREREYILRVLATLILLGPVPVDEGIRTCEALGRRAEGNLLTKASVCGVVARLRAMRADFELARKVIAEAKNVSAELGITHSSATLAVHAGVIELLAGDSAAATRELEWGCMTLERLGERLDLATAAAHLASALYVAGEYEDAERWLRVVDESGYHGELETTLVSTGTRAKLLARHGRLREANELANATLGRALDTDFVDLRGDAFSDAGEVSLLRGDTRAAAAALTNARREYASKGNVVSTARTERALRDLAPKVVR